MSNLDKKNLDKTEKMGRNNEKMEELRLKNRRQRLHESGALPDQRRESAQLNVNKLTILRLSAFIFSPFGVLSILWIKGVEGAPFLDIYLCSL